MVQLVGPYLLWRHTVVGDAHAPKKLQTDVHTPKNPEAPATGTHPHELHSFADSLVLGPSHLGPP